MTEIENMLSEPVPPIFIKSRTTELDGKKKTLSYVDLPYIIDTANRIFGYHGWEKHVLSMERLEHKFSQNKHTVVMLAKVSVSRAKNVRESYGISSATSYSLHDAYEVAVKGAETDALKRCFVTFGNIFGLSLYKSEHLTLKGTDNEPTRPRDTRTEQEKGEADSS